MRSPGLFSQLAWNSIYCFCKCCETVLRLCYTYESSEASVLREISVFQLVSKSDALFEGSAHFRLIVWEAWELPMKTIIVVNYYLYKSLIFQVDSIVIMGPLNRMAISKASRGWAQSQ